MPFILVTPLSALEHTIDAYGPSHLITLLSPEYMIETPRQIAAERHLRLALHDVAETLGCEAPPTERHVARLLDFGHSWPATAPMLIHCWAGVSRSMAAAYTLLCERAGAGCEFEIAQLLRARAPHAYPNPLIVRLADAALQRKGRMIAAATSIGRGEIAAEGRCVQLPLTLPAR
ncbi:MAG: tyrosine phosphatase family protein [Rhizomicrobium sp.]